MTTLRTLGACLLSVPALAVPNGVKTFEAYEIFVPYHADTVCTRNDQMTLPEEDTSTGIDVWGEPAVLDVSWFTLDAARLVEATADTSLITMEAKDFTLLTSTTTSTFEAAVAYDVGSLLLDGTASEMQLVETWLDEPTEANAFELAEVLLETCDEIWSEHWVVVTCEHTCNCTDTCVGDETDWSCNSPSDPNALQYFDREDQAPYQVNELNCSPTQPEPDEEPTPQ